MFWNKKKSKKKSPAAQWWPLPLAVFLLMLSLDSFYLAVRLPNWNEYATGPIKKSRFIERYEEDRVDHPEWPSVAWKPVPLTQIPKHLIRAAIVAEDSRFFVHSGFDGEAWQDAMEHNLAKGRFIYGGSTISQQTVKNMFFSPSRNPLRKWHEVVFTYSMEGNLKKRRIIEMYLNVAEFGRGIYGVEAASRHYFNKSVSEITIDEALELAATLPGPVSHNPASRTRFFQRHKRTVARHYAAH